MMVASSPSFETPPAIGALRAPCGLRGKERLEVSDSHRLREVLIDGACTFGSGPVAVHAGRPEVHQMWVDSHCSEIWTVCATSWAIRTFAFFIVKSRRMSAAMSQPWSTTRMRRPGGFAPSGLDHNLGRRDHAASGIRWGWRRRGGRCRRGRGGSGTRSRSCSNSGAWARPKKRLAAVVPSGRRL
jgi:hypothetical protein